MHALPACLFCCVCHNKSFPSIRLVNQPINQQPTTEQFKTFIFLYFKILSFIYLVVWLFSWNGCKAIDNSILFLKPSISTNGRPSRLGCYFWGVPVKSLLSAIIAKVAHIASRPAEFVAENGRQCTGITPRHFWVVWGAILIQCPLPYLD